MPSLSRFSTLGQEPEDANARKAARDAWHKHGIVLINPSWLSGWADRKQLEILAEHMFGKRKAGS